MADDLRAHCLSAAQQICEECDAILAAPINPDIQADDEGDPKRQTLAGCGEPLVQLLNRQASSLVKLHSQDARGDCTGKNRETSIRLSREQELILKRLDDIISIAYAQFYAYVYKDLPLCWRQLYTDASILKFCSLLFDSHESTSNVDAQRDGMIKALDLALILAGAGGSSRGRRWIDKAFILFQQSFMEEAPNGSILDDHPRKRAKLSDPSEARTIDEVRFSAAEPFTPPVKNAIRRAKPMALDGFQDFLDKSANTKCGPEPLIFSHISDGWPARTTNPWDSPAYLLSQTFDGRRLVPVEIGRSYVDEGWGQKIVSFRDFLREYIDPSTSASGNGTGVNSATPRTVAYLAQHQLFTQLPQLRNDILIPDYCYTSPPPHPTDTSQDQPELEAPMLNAWFGPPGTITPLHTDPYHNLLVQIVGRKYVRLYSPLQTDRMMARGKEAGVEMGNTSSLDVGVVEGWDPASDDEDIADEEKSTRRHGYRDYFCEVPFVDCILEPGDTLYIPIGWWHYVRGLRVSFSVSFWWN